MRLRTRELLILGGLLLVALGVGAYLHFQNVLTAKNLEGEVSATGADNYQFNTEAVTALGENLPNLKREVQFGSWVIANARVDLQGKIDVVRARLLKDKNRADDWFTLAVLYHGSNDFDAARDVWEFLLKAVPAPQSAIVHDNLGKLYKFDLKDFPKSEMYFKESIQANPNSLTPYTELHELYRYLYKTETSLAVDILKEAANTFPNETDPYVLLGGYYRDQKRYAEARSAYGKAIERAEANGNIDLVGAIRHDMESLPQ
jgi:tetratricopeptide (TPR) repeat protein